LLFQFKEDVIHPGLADRLKAIIGCYFISKKNNIPFKISFDNSLDLSDYLVPNTCDWRISNEEINHSVFGTRLLNYSSDFDFPPHTPRSTLQYHVIQYLGNNHKGIGNNPIEWSRLFNELFKPSEYLQSVLHQQKLFGKEYIAVHFRFVNNFEINEERYFTRPLSREFQIKLEQECLNYLNKLSADESKPILVFSDSPHFIELIKRNHFETLEGSLGHISYDKTKSSMLKTFVDLFMISGASKIIGVVNDVLYSSAFPVYGGLISGKECSRVHIKNVISSDNVSIYR
jgi:hypothetical protein